MSHFKKVGTGTIEYVKEVGCSTSCSKSIPVNKGLPLPCKEFNNIESALLRKRALKDEQLFASGFTKIVERSAVGDDLRIKDFKIDIGEIRTEASGARKISECKYNFEGVTIDQWEKRFYVVNTNKHLKLCPREFVGKSLQDLIGDRMTDFDEFQDTDLADILVGAIVEKYNTEFVAKFILLAVWNNAGENMHGDDGVLAKAYYAWKGQYFQTIQFDLSALESGKTLVAIVGGNKYSLSVLSSGGNSSLTVLDFVNWINDLKESKDYLYNASVSGLIVTVVSKFATAKIRLRVGIVDDGVEPNWSGPTCSPESTVPTTVLQNAMPINDVPLLFKYETIDETNFVALFKKYTKEFTRYLHRNGFTDVSIADIKIGIDPELMLERDDAITGKYLAGGIAIDFMTQIGLAESRFKPLNALNGTGLFFMTIEENILVLGDTSNEGNGLPGTGNVKIMDICDGEFAVIFDNPIGSAVEIFGAFASNLCDSYFVIDNKLDERQPYENTRQTLMCYSDTCRENELQLGCSISAEVSSSIVFVPGAGIGETKITVTTLVSNPNNVANILYDLGYSLSDGTSQNGLTSGSFVITLPGDQTASGLVLNVFGTIAATSTITPGEIATSYCTTSVSHNVQLGSSETSPYCDWSAPVDVSGSITSIKISYDLLGSNQVYSLIDTSLNITLTADWPAIEDEMEAIFPNSTVVISGTSGAPVLTITNVISAVSNVVISFVGGADPTELVSSCV